MLTFSAVGGIMILGAVVMYFSVPFEGRISPISMLSNITMSNN